jgi:hypothetical protein
MSEGERSEQPRKGEDEELYTVRLTIYPRLVSGFPHYARKADEPSEADLFASLQAQEEDYLSTQFNEAVERENRRMEAGEGSMVRLTLRDLSIQRGSITLIAILGAVYVGVKDYEAVRQSLLLIASDVRNFVARFLAERYRAIEPFWAVDSAVMVGTPAATPQPPGGPGVSPIPVPIPPVQNPSPVNWSNWLIGLMLAGFILYLAITNIVLIRLLVSLLARTLSQVT